MSENAIKFTLYPKKPPHAAVALQTYPEVFTRRACGKAIIIGEHAVVYGARSIAMPISSMQMAITLERLAEHPDQPACTLGDARAPAELAGVVDEAFALLGAKPFPVRIEGHSDILIGSGLGSSAALCIVIVRSLAACLGITLSTERLAFLGNELEKRFHGTPSGLDTAVVAYEQTIAFQKLGSEKWIEPVPVQAIPVDGYTLPWTFALIDSQVRSSTLAMISLVAPYFRGAKGALRLDRFNALASQLGHGLAAGAWEQVGLAMTEAAAMLTEGGVITPVLAEIIAEARRIGVAAAKPTGAGGGGCILALLDPRRAQAQLEQLEDRFGSKRVVAVAMPLPVGRSSGCDQRLPL